MENRRDFLRMLAAGAAGFGAASKGLAASPIQGGAPIWATPLAHGYVLFSGAGCNVLSLNTSEGTLLVDGGSPDRSDELLGAVAEQPGAGPVEVLFNTHWHLEHTGSNDAIGGAGKRIIAHENTRLWMTTDIVVEWQDGKVYPPRAEVALPNDTFLGFEAPIRMNFGGHEIEYGELFQAHTDGDIYVYFPGPDILMAGDTVAVGHYPILDYSTHGWIGGMANASRTMLGVANPNTKVVPGTGPVQTYRDLEVQSEMLGTIRQRVVEMIRIGYSAQDMLDNNATEGYDARWGNPEAFVRSIYPGLWGHVRELGGIV